jgi:IS1 family transposase
MIDPCPNNNCSHFKKNKLVIRDGTYFRKDDSRKIYRFKCNGCKKRFSSSTKTLEYRQKKRRFNYYIYSNFSSGMSQRRIAMTYNLNQKTIGRKLIYLAKKARLENIVFLQQLKDTPVMHLQFDDLITSIHTKLKPVSISVAVDADTRIILGAKIGVIPAFGKLASTSRRKYGRRKSEHREKLDELLSNITSFVAPDALIKTDEHKTYPNLINKYFPKSNHKKYKGAKSAIAGHGELKRKRYDPLFCINQTLAMLRYSINRLVRRTWSTSKSIERLQDHVDIYINYHNSKIIK